MKAISLWKTFGYVRKTMTGAIINGEHFSAADFSHEAYKQMGLDVQFSKRGFNAAHG